MNSLDKFVFDSGLLKMLKIQEHKDLYRSNKFIKNEVIEIADMVEKVSKTVMIMNDKIEANNV